ncbi:MAG TPA: DUF4435 domain-containing protein [Acidimicrobiales bacterium]|nr:DUF4435 domain-containing protein [Acidimicrobiales bacterium]
MSQRSSTRRTLDELRTLYSLFPDVREVLVEGNHDRIFLVAFIVECESEAVVFAVDDRVLVEKDLVDAAGVDEGARGRLIAIAHAIQQWDENERAHLTCLVDADRGYLGQGSGIPFSYPELVVTDLGSIEVYALTKSCIRKFLSVVLRVEVAVDLDTFVSSLESALVELFLARAVLHESGCGISLHEKAAKYGRHDGGVVQYSADELLTRTLPGDKNADLLSELKTRVTQMRKDLPKDDLRRAVRGHDIAPVLIHALQLKNDFAHPETVERALCGCVDWVDLRQQHTFAALLERVGTKAA